MKVTEPKPSAVPIDPKKVQFKAERKCRVGVPINCAEFWGSFSSFKGSQTRPLTNYESKTGDTLLLGTDEGLFAYDTDDKEAKMVPVSNRRYTQLAVVEELGILLSISGNPIFSIISWSIE
jgi:hypothetical protein